LEFKGVRRFKSNTSGPSIDLRVRRRRRHGATIYGRIGNNTKGDKGERSTQGESVATKRSVIEQNGDQHGYTRGCKCEQENNHVGHSNIIGKEVFAFQILTDSCGYKQSRIMTSMLKG
jgi:hypothetical protein